MKEIKKALEFQRDSLVYLKDNVVEYVSCKDILTLINELESENDRLQRDFVVKAYDKLRAENRQLRNRLKNTQSAMQDWDKLIENFKENAKQRVCGENLDGLVLAIRILQDIREKGLLGGEDNGST